MGYGVRRGEGGTTPHRTPSPPPYYLHHSACSATLSVEDRVCFFETSVCHASKWRASTPSRCELIIMRSSRFCSRLTAHAVAN